MPEAVEQLSKAVTAILPEVALLLTVCVHFLAGPFLVSDRNEAPAGLRHRWGGLALLGLAVALALWWAYPPTRGTALTLGPFQADDLTWYVRGLMLLGGLVLLLMSWNQVEDNRAAEHHACLLLIVAGVNLVASANDLVGLFLALELVSIPTYVMLYLARHHNEEGQEAVIKYFLLSVFSSALLLFGFSYLYGVTGTTNLTGIHAALWTGSAEPMPAVLSVAAMMVIAGLAFRITAVPFHFYAPDVFQGTATTGAALLAFVPKVAGFVALVRLLMTPALAEPLDPLWSLAERSVPILWVLAAASMFVGNVIALQQTDVRRLLAWSSIAHAGYMLVGLTAGRQVGAVGGVEALLFYLAAYGAMTVGVFAVLVALGRGGRRVETTDDLAGLSQTHPAAALAMTVFLFSLTGLPPTAGFLGKLNLFLAAWSAGTLASQSLAVLLAINAAIGAWYYLRLIGVMYLQAPAETVRQPLEVPAYIGAGLCAAATIGLFVVPNWIWQVIQQVGI